MTDNLILYILYLSQMMLLSYYIPKKVAARSSEVFTRYPPSEYPRLYLFPLEYHKQKQGTYRMLNSVILALCAVFLGYIIVQAENLSYGVLQISVFFSGMLQLLPIVIMEVSDFRYFKLMREADKRTQKTASLAPRRLLQHTSPLLLTLATAIYIVTVLYSLSLADFNISWDTDVVQGILVITATHVYFVGIVAWRHFSKKGNPYQAASDKSKEMAMIIKSAIFTSIAVNLFFLGSLVTEDANMEWLKPVNMSVYMQLLGFIFISISINSYSISDYDFSVYKEDKTEGC